MSSIERARLIRLIRAEVKAQLKRYARAKRSGGFVAALNAVLGTALSHHYRAMLAVLNARTDQVEKWRRQKEKFLQQFAIRLVMPLKSKKLDRKKAVEQSLKEVMETDALRRRVESLTFQKTYRLKKLYPLPENAHEEFLAEVRAMVDEVFPD